jgi:PPOX class probable F420-dependent enzyme
MAFDPNDSKLANIVKRLRDDEVGWLVTVQDGAPRPVPVWFLWDGKDTLLVYSPPNSLKTKTVGAHPQVAFHFNSADDGGDIAILYGHAGKADGIPPLLENHAYMAKYSASLKAHAEAIGTTPEAISAEYNVPLVMTIERANGW